MKQKTTKLRYIIKLIKYLSGYHSYMLLAVLCNFLYQALPITISTTVSYIINTALTGNVELIQRLFVCVCIMIPLAGLFSYLDVLFAHDMAYKILTDLRNKAYDKVNQAAPAALVNEQSGNLVSIIMEDIELLEWFYAHIIPQFIVSVISTVLILAFIGHFSTTTVFCIIPFIFALFFVPRVKEKNANKQGKAERKYYGILNAVIVDGVQGLQDIVSFRWQNAFFSRFFKANDDYNQAHLKYSARTGGENSAIFMIAGLGSALSQVSVAVLAIQHTIESSWIIPLMVLSSAVFTPIMTVMRMEVNYGLILGAAERLSRLFDLTPSVEDIGTKSAEEVKAKGSISVYFNHVSFAYSNCDEQSNCDGEVIRDFSFQINTGETVALVGASGAGKTTTARLLQRFWDVDSGAIEINGINIRELKLCELRRLCTLVPQESYFFNETIEQNLRYANPEADFLAIQDAAEKAHISDFIKKLPLNYQTVIGEKGMRLSGGEKQRLSIARAFLKNSPILILDEASANLDSENERLINLAINQLKKGKATLVIAHRVSTMKNADRIVMIQNGTKCCEGSYEELIAENPLFRALVGAEYGAKA